MRLIAIITGLAVAMFASLTANATQPENWDIWHQEPGSKAMADIVWFDAYTLWFIIPITLLVLVLLLIVMVKFNAKANPEPSRTTHNLALEAAWTFIPILILVFIAIPSFKLLDEQLAPTEEPAMTVKATGYQWYWGFEYQDDSELSFDSLLLREQADMEAAGKTDLAMYPKLLAVDNEMVVPVNTMVRVLVTSADVLHAFALPSFGLKLDAVPGRLNETWFKAEREGLYYGQCSELCGRDHAYMPIGVRVVSQEQYNAWKAAATEDLEGANKALMAEIEMKKKVEMAGN